MKNPQSEGTVLITGATSGIGLELTKLFAKANYDLVLVARNKEELTTVSQMLQAKYDVFIKIVAKDLSDKDTPNAIYDELQKDSIEIDMLINNAGFATHGEFVQIPEKQDLDLLAVNITSLTHLTKLFLPEMIKRKSGRILNLASTAAFYPGPLMATYYASKAYVLSFSEALAEEVAGTGVTVTTLCPGPTRTNFEKRAGMTFNSPTMSPTEVAAIGYNGLMQGKRVVFAGKRNFLQSFGSRFVGRSFAAKIIKRFNK